MGLQGLRKTRLRRKYVVSTGFWGCVPTLTTDDGSGEVLVPEVVRCARRHRLP